jgi:hypothetical protein
MAIADNGSRSGNPGPDGEGPSAGDNEAHQVELLVNQDEHNWTKRKITYGEVVALYLSDGGASSTEYLIKYSHGPHQNPSGTLAPASEVKVQDGMRFRVSGTGES